MTDTPASPLPDRYGMRYSYVYEPDHPDLPRSIFATCATCGTWQLEVPISEDVSTTNAILRDHLPGHAE